MTLNPDAEDPKIIWKNQKRERPTTSAQEVQNRVRKYRVKARREAIIAFVLSLATVAFCVVVVASHHPAAPIALAAATLLLAALGREMLVFRKTHNRIWPWLPRIAMTDRVPTACVDFYRRGLQRQIQGRAMRYADLFILIGILVASLFSLPGQIPIYFYVLVAICIGLMFLVRRRRARKIRLEIEALSSFEAEGRQ